MGATPVATLLSLALPEERFGKWSAEFMRGYHAASKKYGVKLVGGDTTKSELGVCVNVTAIGRAPMTEIKRRSAAKVSDIVMVTGKLGASAAGLRDVLAGKAKSRNARVHLMPEARVAEGVWLGEQAEVHAMMDISDGIASDLEHIAKQSKKSVVVTWKNLPIAKGATAEDAFGGGEDYELLLTVDKHKADELAQCFEQKFGKPLYRIGRVLKSNCDCYKILIERGASRLARI
jgi:thiamine-monophosphate kinase